MILNLIVMLFFICVNTCRNCLGILLNSDESNVYCLKDKENLTHNRQVIYNVLVLFHLCRNLLHPLHAGL